MSLPLKNAILSRADLKSTLAVFVKSLKKEYANATILSFSRDISTQQIELISVAVSEEMDTQLVEQINQRIETLMKQGFQMRQMGSEVNIQHQIQGAHFDPTAQNLRFGPA